MAQKERVHRFEIVVLLPSLAGGGAERAAINLLRGLDRSVFHPSLVLTMKKGPYLKEVPDDVQIFELGRETNLMSKTWNYTRKLSKVVQQTRADIVMSFLNQANTIALLTKLSDRKHFKVVMSVQNDQTAQFGYRSAIEKWRKRMFVRFLYPSANGLVAVSQGVKDDLARNFFVPASKISVIHNPIQLDRIRAMATLDMDKIAIDKNQKVIIGVGRLVKQKGFDDLIRAFALVQSRMPAKLLILGEGPLRGELEEIVNTLGLEDDVLMPGFVTNPWLYMARADVFVLSSHWEGFATVVAEAMACGVPVIATDCNYGPRESITDGENGLLVPVGNVQKMSEAILHLLSQPTEGTRLKANALRRAEDFESERICRQYEQLFETVLHERI